MTPPLAYVTLRGDYSPGAFRQVRESARVAARANLPIEFYWIRTASARHPVPPHVTVIEVENRFRGSAGLRLAQYQAIARLARSRPSILLRYPIADPLLLSLTYSSATIFTEHHSKEVEELSLDQPGRARLERWFGPPVLRRTAGIVAVTREILDYERARAGARPGLVACNAIDVDGNAPGWMDTPWRPAVPLKLLFAASTVQPWHGLDLIIDALAEVAPSRYELHVCGRADATHVEQASARGVNAVFHGRLPPDRLWSMYEQMHAGIGAFGLHRSGLAAASSLKVREYLHAGLPVILQGADDALPGDFPYVLSLSTFDFNLVERWHATLGIERRGDVRAAARPYISLEARLRALCAFAADPSGYANA